MTNRDPIQEFLPLVELRQDDRMRPITLRRAFSEGYPTGNYSIEDLTIEDLQRLADWLITLPQSLYESVQNMHKALERAIIADHERYSS